MCKSKKHIYERLKKTGNVGASGGEQCTIECTSCGYANIKQCTHKGIVTGSLPAFAVCAPFLFDFFLICDQELSVVVATWMEISGAHRDQIRR